MSRRIKMKEKPIKIGDFIILQKQNYKKLHKLNKPDSVVTLGRDNVNLSGIEGRPYFSTFKLVPGGKRGREYRLKHVRVVVALKDEIDIKTSGTDNRNITDDGCSQKLSHSEIADLANDADKASAIVETLISNSNTFHNKTEFSQQKYLKKKEKKYSDYIQILKPNPRLIAEIMYRLDANKIQNLRIDMLSQIITMSNVQSEGVHLLYDSGSNGLVAAALLSAIGEKTPGILVNMHPGNMYQKQAIQAMNFPEEHLNRCVSVNIYSVLRQIYQGCDTNTTKLGKSLKNDEKVEENCEENIPNIKKGIENTEKVTQNGERGTEYIEKSVENSEKDIESTKKAKKSTEKGINDTKNATENTAKDKASTEKAVENTEKGMKSTEKSIENIEKGIKNMKNDIETAENSTKNVETCTEIVERGIENPKEVKESNENITEDTESSIKKHNDTESTNETFSTDNNELKTNGISDENPLKRKSEDEVDHSCKVQKIDDSNHVHDSDDIIEQSTSNCKLDLCDINVGGANSTNGKSLSDNVKENHSNMDVDGAKNTNDNSMSENVKQDDSNINVDVAKNTNNKSTSDNVKENNSNTNLELSDDKPTSDNTKDEPDSTTDEPEVLKTKAASDSEPFLPPPSLPPPKKPKWHFDNLKAAKLLTNKVDSLIIACKESPLHVFNELMQFVKPGRPFVVYYPMAEPLQHMYVELKCNPKVVALKLTCDWMRNYQVLPDRTHPEVTMNSQSGFLLTGYIISN